MSSAPHHSTLTAVEPALALAVSWSIARQAVRTALPDLELPPARGRGGDVVLTLEVRGQGCSAELRDTQTGRSHPIELGPTAVSRLRADQFVHVSVAESKRELFSATLRETDGIPRLLYARTSLLARLGIRGGRYARPSLGGDS